MPTPNYDALVEKVRLWANRDLKTTTTKSSSSNTLPNHIISDCLKYATDDAFSVLRIPPLEFTKKYGLNYLETQTTPMGSGYFSSVTVLDVPANLTEFIHIRAYAEDGSTIRVFDNRVSPNMFWDRNEKTPTDCDVWMRQGGKLYLSPGLQLSGIDAEVGIELYYYGRLPALGTQYEVSPTSFRSGLLWNIPKLDQDPPLPYIRDLVPADPPVISEFYPAHQLDTIQSNFEITGSLKSGSTLSFTPKTEMSIKDIVPGYKYEILSTGVTDFSAFAREASTVLASATGEVGDVFVSKATLPIISNPDADHGTVRPLDTARKLRVIWFRSGVAGLDPVDLTPYSQHTIVQTTKYLTNPGTDVHDTLKYTLTDDDLGTIIHCNVLLDDYVYDDFGDPVGSQRSNTIMTMSYVGPIREDRLPSFEGSDLTAEIKELTSSFSLNPQEIRTNSLSTVIQAIDPDGDTIVYRLDGTSLNNGFLISPSTGTIQFHGEPNKSVTPEYEVVVTAQTPRVGRTHVLKVSVLDGTEGYPDLDVTFNVGDYYGFDNSLYEYVGTTQIPGSKFLGLSSAYLNTAAYFKPVEEEALGTLYFNRDILTESFTRQSPASPYVYDDFVIPRYFIGKETLNWLRDENEKVLLYGALSHLFHYLGNNVEKAMEFKALFEQEIQRLNGEAEMRNISGGSISMNYNVNEWF